MTYTPPPDDREPPWTPPPGHRDPTSMQLQPPKKKRHTVRWVLAGLAGLLFVFVIVALASAGGGHDPAPSAAQVSSAMKGSDVPAPAVTANPKATTFGSPHVYRDGLAITVTAPRPFQPSNSAAGWKPGGQAAAVDVTVTNGGTQNYDPTLLSVSAQSGQTESSEIFDSAKGVEGSPDTLLLPGRSVTFTAAFTVTDSNDVVVQVSPGFQYDAEVFAR